MRYSFNIEQGQSYYTEGNPYTTFSINYLIKCNNNNIQVYPYPTLRYACVALFFLSL